MQDAIRERIRQDPRIATREERQHAWTALEDPSYVQSLRARLRAGKAAHLETLLYHYGYGKPKDPHEGTGEFVLRWED